MYAELPGYKASLTEPLFHISPEAANGLYWYRQVNSDWESRRDLIIDEFDAAEPEVSDVINYMMESWQIEPDQEDYFLEGAAVAYKLLSYQAEIEDERGLPVLEAEVATAYFKQLSTFWDNQLDYVENSLIYHINHHGDFVEALHDYMVECDHEIENEDAESYILGALSLFDLLYQQAKFDDIEMTYGFPLDIHIEGMSRQDLASIHAQLKNPTHQAMVNYVMADAVSNVN